MLRQGWRRKENEKKDSSVESIKVVAEHFLKSIAPKEINVRRNRDIKLLWRFSFLNGRMPNFSIFTRPIEEPF